MRLRKLPTANNEALKAVNRLTKLQAVVTESEELAEVRAIFHAFDRLRKMGWREAIYAPRDNSPLLLIEAGSTGIHDGYRDEHGFWVVDGDTYPSHPILWRNAVVKRA